MIYSHRPPFFQIIVHFEDPIPGLTGLCASYEMNEWRYTRLSEYLFEYLTEFALKYSEFSLVTGSNAAQKLRECAKIVYQKYHSRRGEFGELLLHTILREIYHSVPAISKIYFKDGPNETVKGFDAVHLVKNAEEQLELWLGEVKFYQDIGQAINAVIAEIKDHLQADYLRNEFMAVIHKIDDGAPYSGFLQSLLNPNNSLDTIVSSICIPVLLTYDSKTVQAHTSFCDDYKRDIEQELRNHHGDFATKLGNVKVRVHLFLLPLKEKQVLLQQLNNRLTAWQHI